jgi:diguanylate cyclase (GGDEF)-like protein
MPLSPFTADEFSELSCQLDEALQLHLGWQHRLLRDAMLGGAPRPDTVQPDAHELCGFGRWFRKNQSRLSKLNAASVTSLDEVHQAMHGAVRELYLARLGGKYVDPRWFDEFETSQSLMVKNVGQIKEHLVRSGAQIDPLTGLPLRHDLPGLFDLRQADARRGGQCLWLVIMDVDHFKRINDRYGHPVGDAVLVHLAALLRASLRNTDVIIRYGGEEFVFLMQAASTAMQRVSMERIFSEIRRSPLLTPDGASIPLTVSVGCVQVGLEESQESAINRADAGLYEAKRQGRDRYVLLDDGSQEACQMSLTGF